MSLHKSLHLFHFDVIFLKERFTFISNFVWSEYGAKRCASEAKIKGENGETGMDCWPAKFKGLTIEDL